MKIIVAGSRDFDDYERLARLMDRLTAPYVDVVVLSGAAKGADALGERWAFGWMWTVMRFHADWNRHGKAAGPIRNQEMVDAADAAVFFWKGGSKGTADCIARAKKKGIRTKVVEC